jgi:hypothetical protein
MFAERWALRRGAAAKSTICEALLRAAGALSENAPEPAGYEAGLGGALEGGEVLRRQHELRLSRSPRPLSERLISLTYERPARRTEQSLTTLCQVAVASVDVVRRRLYEPGAPIVGQAGNLCGALDVAPADRQIGDEAKDDDRQRQRDRSGA